MTEQVKASDEEMEVVCTVIATAEYCADVAGALGRSIAKTLEPPFCDQARSVKTNSQTSKKDLRECAVLQ